MTTLIDSVADLTVLHDQDELEVTLATVMYELTEASTLTLWRLIRRDGVIRLRERVSLPAASSAASNGKALDLSHLPLIESRPDLRSCFDANLHLRQPVDENGMFSHLFPVSDGRDVICLLEIRRPVPLRVDEEGLVFGLLRIYRNHLGILDYSDRDELTGLLNRRTFDESFKRASAQDNAKAGSQAFVPDRRDAAKDAYLAIIDIDFFKRVNDQFGHPYGDEVLVLLARLMGQCFRDTDRLFRFGGEEFLVILPNTDLQDVETALERFRAAVEAFAFPQVGRVTVSIGVTMIVEGDTGLNAFGRADEALYVAKHEGRNQVRCYELLIAEGILNSRQDTYQEIEMF